MIRVVIADDHSVVRRGIRVILVSRPDVEVCGEAADGLEVINTAVRLKPDLIILDLLMPVMGGFSAAKVLHGMLPEVPILLYSMDEGEHIIAEAKQLGVRGFVGKSNITHTLLDAVDALVVRRTTFFPDAKTVPLRI